MAIDVVTVPIEVMRQTAVAWNIDWRGAPPIETMSATDVYISNAFPRWIGAPDMVLTPDLVRTWRGILWAAQGRAKALRIPMIDPVAFNRDAISGASQYIETGIPFSTGATFSTGVGFEFSPSVEAASAAAAGATELTIKTASSELVPIVGQIMSHDDYPFGVTSVEGAGGGTYTLGVQMPLRSAIAAGDPISCIGVGIFRIADDDGGNIAYNINKIATPSLSLSEVLTR